MAIDLQNMSKEERLYRMRHSAAHIMAEAVLDMFPEAKFAIGPPTDTGFYYDFDLPRPLTPEDLPLIEAKMRERIASDVPFVHSDISKDEAHRRFSSQPYKLELIDGIEDPNVSLYTHDDFVDLCQGPHVLTTGQVPAFKLISTAGAYWRGDEHRSMLQRIYGVLFETEKELNEHLAQMEEAQRRDHRRLGRELELFMTDPVAPGSPFFFPKGATVYNLLVQYVRDLYKRYGYQEVITPQVYSSDLWHRSGHYDNYVENIFFIDIEDREFGLKPMNCPGHAMMYAANLHSYRELPLRYADFGRLHRFERSGVLHGLTRVRSFAQDDAHIFCRPDQVQGEVHSFLQMLLDTYRNFHFDDVNIQLSLRPDKRVGTDEMWDKAEDALRHALRTHEIEFTEIEGEGAFYGPKIDFMVTDALKREWQLGTVQLDFNLPERFDLEYVTEDGGRERPVMVHRAVLGSLERFIGVLIEHYAGAFPVWLAPVQAIIIPIADRHVQYCREVAEQLNFSGLRIGVDDSGERMNAKIRHAQLQKIPYMLVVGDREVDNNSTSVRTRAGEDLGRISVAELQAKLAGESTLTQ